MSCSTSRSSWAVLRRLLLRAHLAGGLLVAGEPGQRVEQAAVLPTVYGRTGEAHRHDVSPCSSTIRLNLVSYCEATFLKMAATAAANAACCAFVLLFVRGVARSLRVRSSAAEASSAHRRATALPRTAASTVISAGSIRYCSHRSGMAR